MRSSQHPTRGDNRAAAERNANVSVAKTHLPIPHALLSRLTVHDLDTRLVARSGCALSATLSLLGAHTRCALEARKGQRQNNCPRCRHVTNKSAKGEQAIAQKRSQIAANIDASCPHVYLSNYTDQHK
jgi:hypothetical protein